MKKAMIVAGELSGEIYGARLARSLRNIWGNVDISGMGGTSMEKEGVRILAPITPVVGLTEGIRHLFQIKKNLGVLTSSLKESRPDVVILIDYPDFNLRLAARAKACGTKVLYYVSPQVWAWRKGRVKRIASLADKMAVILPFEIDIYKSAGLPCEFVGHPILEELNIDKDKKEVKRDLGLDEERPVISILPGSRMSEVKRLLPLMADAVKELRRQYKGIQYVLPFAQNLDRGEFDKILRKMDDVKVIDGMSREALYVSELALIASGTAAIEAAFLGVPGIVLYRLSSITYLFGKMLVKVRFISLVNILLNEEVFPELIQGKATVKNIMDKIKYVLDNREGIVERLKGLRHLFEDKRASERVAVIAGELAGWNRIKGF